MSVAQERPVWDWIDDFSWHRHMFDQSRFRWGTEDVTTLALHYTRGRLEFNDLADLARLDGQLLEVREHVLGLQARVAVMLRAARGELGHVWSDVIALMGLTPEEASFVLWSTAKPVDDHDTRAVLKGIPWKNPVTQAYELLQLISLFEAVTDLLEDGVCDLAEELLRTRPAHVVASRTIDQTSARLQTRIGDNLHSRGPAGDPRRTPHQTYPERPPAVWPNSREVVWPPAPGSR